MESIDVMVLRTARDWLAEGHRVLLATVVRTWGSSPRPVGSMMILRDDGRAVGSVSGGCIEDDLIHCYTKAFGGRGIPNSIPQVVRYGVSADEAHRFGLPCGGTLELVLEFIPPLSSLGDSLDELVSRLETGQLVKRIVQLTDGSVRLVNTAEPESLKFNDAQLINTLGPGYRMLIIGAGALAEYLSTMALFNGFKITICDPRSEYIDTWSVAGVEISTAMPDDAVYAFRPDIRTCIVALSHDPKLDDLALLQALQSPAFYIGAIGSRRNNRSRRDRLITHFGETEDSLKRLRGPVGIYIGSKTPAEIAVSVMAEIIAVKNGVALPVEMSIHQAKLAQEAAATE
ncbi:cytochrome oxidase I [Pseudomonas sp. JY-Q]|uniref:XdhC family protein n=1 Tax=Pseudomonadaceae TaxID=135621 RepID=UPI0007DCE64A|nr:MULTISPECIES: XdhC family protein [Pseudomonadaceae]ANI32701.1 cytochrome oxidase I [Pseudomonas sp. JY-Q]